MFVFVFCICIDGVVITVQITAPPNLGITRTWICRL